MYNSGNSSKNVTGASVVDGTLESADFADDGLSGNKIDGGIISNFQSTGIDDNATSTKLTIADTGADVTGSITCDAVHIDVGSGTLLSAGSGADTTVISNGWTGGIGDWLKLEVPSGDDESGMLQLGSDGGVYFSGGGVEKIRFQAAGGISFNGDTAAANALDDYEEGTWTPEYFISGTDFTSVTYDIQAGYYTKIGNTVHCTLQLRTDAITVGSASGSAQITGLPFAAASPQGFGPGKYDEWTTPPMAFDISSGQNVLYLRVENSTSSLTQTAFKTGTNDNLLSIVFHYNA